MSQLSSDCTCMCVLGWNSFMVWEGIAPGGLDLQSNSNLKSWILDIGSKSSGTCHCYPDSHWPVPSRFPPADPLPAYHVSIPVPVFCTHLSEILDNYSTAFWNLWNTLLLVWSSKSKTDVMGLRLWVLPFHYWSSELHQVTCLLQNSFPGLRNEWMLLQLYPVPAISNSTKASQHMAPALGLHSHQNNPTARLLFLPKELMMGRV